MTRCVECGGPVDDDGCAIGDRDDAHTTPEDAEAMVALADELQLIARLLPGRISKETCAKINAAGETIAALARLREADRAEIERLTQERRMIVSHATMGGTDGVGLSLNDISVRITALRNELYNDGKARAEAAEARLTALEADRVKVAETALRMAADACEDYPSTAPDRDRWEPYDDQIEHCQHAILAITPAAVLAQAEKEADNG
jgi:hypothetical protein